MEPGDFIVVYRGVTRRLESHPRCIVNERYVDIGYGDHDAARPDRDRISSPAGSLHPVST